MSSWPSRTQSARKWQGFFSKGFRIGLNPLETKPEWFRFWFKLPFEPLVKPPFKPNPKELRVWFELPFEGFSVPTQRSDKDRGGPSKGGFLNNRLVSYTVLYLCNEINGVYHNNRLFMKRIDYSGNHLYWDHLCLAPVLVWFS